MKFSYHHSIFDVNCLVFIDCVTLYHNEIGKGIKIRNGCLIDFSSDSCYDSNTRNHISLSNILDILSIIFGRKMNSFTE